MGLTIVYGHQADLGLSRRWPRMCELQRAEPVGTSQRRLGGNVARECAADVSMPDHTGGSQGPIRAQY